MKDKISQLHNYVLEKRFKISLALVIIISFIYRIYSYKTYISEDGTVQFTGIDSAYHFRAVMYTIHNWPNTLGFDPGTGYPTGGIRGQFGTIFDQFMALISFLVSGGGMPSTETVRLVMLFTPPILFVLVIISVYMISSKIMDKYAGIISATFISVISTPIFYISSAGRVDHHIAELVAMSFIVLSFIYAFSLIEKLEKIGDLHNFKFIIVYSVLCTMATLLYVSVWPPGVFIIALTAVFYYIYSILAKEKIKRQIILIFGLFQLSTLSLLSPLLFDFSLKVNFSSISNAGLSNIGVLHLSIILLSLSLVAFLTLLSITLKKFNLENYYIPISLFTFSFSTVVFYFQINNIFDYIIAKSLEYIGLGMTENAKIWVTEEFPAIRYGFFNVLISYYGIFAFFFLLFLIYPFYKRFKRENVDIKYYYIYYMSIFFLLLFLTQSKYSYYFTLFASIASVYILFTLAKRLNWDYMGNIEMWKHVLFISLVISLSFSYVFLPSFYNEGLKDSNEWMVNNTPEPEIEVNNYSKLASYDKNSFNYSNESYGIITLPGYGHWITLEAERIPFTNPFHTHMIEYNRYVMAQSEEEAQKVLTEANYKSNKGYVVIDWVMLNNTNTFIRQRLKDSIDYKVYEKVAEDKYLKNQKYYKSLQSRLYLYHGSNFSSPSGGFGIYPYKSVDALENYRYIYGSNSTVTGNNTKGRMKIVEEYTEHDNVKSEDFIPMSSSYTKVFERVPGAEIMGYDASPESQIMIKTKIIEPNNNETFYYKQVKKADKEGNFNFTVPYSTSGYDKWGTEYGYSNPKVHAVSDYKVYSNGNLIGKVDVPESKIIGINKSSIKLDYGKDG